MATITAEFLDKENEKNATKNEIGIAESSQNIEVSLMKEFVSSDSGISMCENNSDISNFTIEKENEKKNSTEHLQCMDANLSEHNSVVEEEKLFQNDNNQFSNNNICLNINNEDENSSPPLNNKSLIEKLYNEKNSKSTLFISNQNLFENSDLTKNCQPPIIETKEINSVINKSNDECNSTSSFKLSNRCSPEIQSQNQNTCKSSINDNTDLVEDNDSCSSTLSTTSRSSNKDNLSMINKLHNENDLRSSKKSSPNKEIQNDSDLKKYQNTDSTENNDFYSTITNSNSKSPIKNISSVVEKLDAITNSNSNVTLSIKNNNDEVQSKVSKAESKKYFTIVDSDSEDEIISQNWKKNEKSNELNRIYENKSSNFTKKLKTLNKRKLRDSDSDKESSELQLDIAQNRSSSEKEDSKLYNKSNKINNLIDSDSESDVDNDSKFDTRDSSSKTNDTKKLKKKTKVLGKKRTGSARASKESAMQQIHSETQRLIRESEISLPYHRPKQRTLQEFLNRKKIISEIPKNLTCAEKVKMFPEMISKVIEEKEKEAEMFYKSSDSESDEESSKIMEINQINIKKQNKDKIETKNEEKNEEKNDNKINIANTQKLTQDDIQDSHNKREILQQRSLDFGVPRKLFMEDLNDAEEIENIETLEKCISKEENLNPNNLAAFKKQFKDVTTGLKESSISRKLFTGDTESRDMDIVNNDTENNNHESIKENLKEYSKLTENDENKNSSENKINPENNTEEIDLNISETELDNIENKKLMESSSIKDLSIQNKDQEGITISETPFINNKELSRLNKASIIPVSDQNVGSETINTEQSTESDDGILKLNNQNNKIEITDYDLLENDFNLPFELNNLSKQVNTKEKILANVLKLNPMIKGSPGSVIDFANSGQMKEGVTRLLDRFVRHSVVIKPKVEKVSEVKIIRTEGVGDDMKIIEETLPFKKIVVEDDDNKEHKPGEKLKKLREDLKRKIAIVRNEEWKQKEECEKEDEEEIPCKGDDFYANLPDEEELLEDEESTESEPEENDVLIVDKRRSKLEFVDEEAEESDNECVEDIDINEDDNEEDKENIEDDDDNDEGDDEDDDDDDDVDIDDEQTENDENEEQKIETGVKSLKPRKLKRIIRPIEDDSNQSELSLINDGNSRLSFDRTKTDEDMFASQTSNSYASEDIEAYAIPPFQPRERCSSDSRSQACKTPLLKPNHILSMISPVAQLTALNASLDSAKKSASKTNNILLAQIDDSRSVGNTPVENSNRPQNSCNLEKMISLPKKLFEDPPETVNDDELLDICSGKFTETQNSERVINNKQNEVTDTQIMDLCSGAFISQSIDMKKLESADSNLQLGDETSQDITLTLDDDDNDDLMNSSAKMSSSMKRSDESMFSSDSKSPIKLPTFGGSTFKNPLETWLKRANEKSAKFNVHQEKQNEVTDSQLLDLCSGNFTSQPINMKELEQNDLPHTPNDISQNFRLTLDDDQKSSFKKGSEAKTKQKDLKSSSNVLVASTEQESNAPWQRFTIVSSDDENEIRPKNKKVKKLGMKKKKAKKLELSDDEDDNRNEFSDDEEIEINEEDEEKYVDYDSDENEIVVVHKKEIKKVAAKFLENEAELSESDWDSADEDEQDMDNLEYEEGDGEEIDEHKLKKQLDKIHVKQMMDEDQKEVRMLQELLFDDGDLHTDGAGRERKFKWKNVDNFGEDNLGPRTNEDDEVDDEVDTVSELQMRKIRYAQNKFLEEKEKNIDEDIEKDFHENQLLKLGFEIVSVHSSTKSTLGNSKITNTHSNINSNFLISNGVSNLSPKTLVNTKSSSLSNMRGSFLSRGDETLIRIAQNLPDKNKQIINPGRKGKFVFEHLSPSVSNIPEENIEQENNNTPDKEIKKARKRKIILSQTPKTTKKLKIEDRIGKKLF